MADTGAPAARAHRTACPYCGVGCGVTLSGQRDALSVSGDSTHPANAGRLCSKGSALGETVGVEGRLLHPMIGNERASWDQATRLVADRFAETIARHGPDAVAFYVSGQLLTEDYYAANKLMKGFIGSGNIDTNSRLCMASAVVAHKLAFGEDVVPACYEDLDLADLVVFSGHNAAWTHPVLYRRMEAQRERGQRHIVIDPRANDTSRGAFLHLKIKPQTDVRLWNGLLAHLDRVGAIHHRYVEVHTSGYFALVSHLSRSDQSPAAIAADCDVPLADLLAFFAAFTETPRTVSLFSMGANQSAQGVAKGLAVINAHLATGRVSKPGASPFSITGQPNAMGGRETGGLSTQLAAHMDFDAASVDRVQRFWSAPRMATSRGLVATEMFEAVHDGRIKAIWIMATNPAVSMPDGGRVREALERCPFVVVSDVIAVTDTSRYAHVRLPALAWGEKDGTVTNSERCITRQRAALPAPGEARADWSILADVAKAMGWRDAFAWRNSAAVFREWAELTNFENVGGGGKRVLKLGALANLTAAGYRDMAPVRWPVDDRDVAETLPSLRPFHDGQFAFPDGRARFVACDALPPANACDAEWPFALNTGRIRDQWHTMTRTGLSPRLMKHAPEPSVTIHPDDCARLGLRTGELSRITTRWGHAVLEVNASEDVRRGELFAPMHWSADFAPWARVNTLVNPAIDPKSGQPEFKHTPSRIEPVAVAWRGWFASIDRRDPPEGLIWRRVLADTGHRFSLSAEMAGPDMLATAEALIGDTSGFEVLDLSDTGGAFVRRALLKDGVLVRAFFATRAARLPAPDWLVERLGKTLDEAERRMVLAGAVGKPSRIVCACFGVSDQEILAFAGQQPEAGLREVSACLKAGSNCGSCRPEIAQLLETARAATAKETEHA